MRPKQDALLRSALAQHNIRAALDGLLPTHPQYAALKAALEVTPATDDGEDQPHPAQHGPLALAAARPRPEVHHRQRARLPRDAGRERRQPLEAARDRRQAFDPDAAAQSATAVGVILNPWWEVPKSIEHEAAGKKGFVPVKGAGRQDPALAAAAGTDQCARPDQVRDAQLEGDLPPRHQRAQPLQQSTSRAQPRLRPHPAHPRPRDRAARRRRRRVDAATRSRRRSTARRRVQANFVKPLPVYIVYFSSAALARRQDRRLQGPLRPRLQGDGGAADEGRRREPGAAQAEAGGPGRGPLPSRRRSRSHGPSRYALASASVPRFGRPVEDDGSMKARPTSPSSAHLPPRARGFRLRSGRAPWRPGTRSATASPITPPSEILWMREAASASRRPAASACGPSPTCAGSGADRPTPKRFADGRAPERPLPGDRSRQAERPFRKNRIRRSPDRYTSATGRSRGSGSIHSRDRRCDVRAWRGPPRMTPRPAQTSERSTSQSLPTLLGTEALGPSDCRVVTGAVILCAVP